VDAPFRFRSALSILVGGKNARNHRSRLDGRRRQVATLVGCLQQALAGGEEARSVLGEATRQRMPPLWLWRHFLGRRETPRMFLDALGAE
jgi:hypothetical protein